MKPVNEMTAKEFQAEMLVWAEAYGFSFIEYRDGVFSVECEDGRVIEAALFEAIRKPKLNG